MTRARTAASVALCLAAGCNLDTSPQSISIPTGTLVFATVVTTRSHSCGLILSGAAYCWGVNTAGELGDGTTVDRNVPTSVSGGLTFASLAAGRATTCGVIADGTAYCWGANAAGQFADGTTIAQMVPTPAAIGHKFKSISFSDPVNLPPYEVCGLETSGAVSCWGRGKTTPVSVAAGFSFTQMSAGIGGTFCGIVAAGDAYCWGFDSFGEQGIDSTGTFTGFGTTPARVLGGHSFTSISVGFAHACGITSDSHLYCWGDDTFSQLGDGQQTGSLLPTLVFGQNLYTAVTTGYDGTCAISTTAAAYCWGLSTSGNLGIGPVNDGLLSIPIAVAGAASFASLSKGLSNTCGVTTTNIAYCWGLGGSGLGIGNDGDRLNAAYTPTKVALQPKL